MYRIMESFFENFSAIDKKIDHNKLIKYGIVQYGQEKVKYFKTGIIEGQIIYDKNSDTFTVKGKLNGISNSKLYYAAAAPCTRNYSYSGSGLPYPNAEIAHDEKQNQGVVFVGNRGEFSVTVKHPASYYVNQGKILLKPHIHFWVENRLNILSVDLCESIPFRSLTSLPDMPNRVQGR